jgi:hypothetical protein
MATQHEPTPLTKWRLEWGNVVEPGDGEERIDGMGLLPGGVPRSVLLSSEHWMEPTPQEVWGVRFQIDIGRREPSVPYAGPFVAFARQSRGRGERIYPMDYWRLTRDGAVEWSRVLGGQPEDQQPVSTTKLFDSTLDEHRDILGKALVHQTWDICLHAEDNEVRPGLVRRECVVAVALQGVWVGTWRSLECWPFAPLLYLEGADATFRVWANRQERCP